MKLAGNQPINKNKQPNQLKQPSCNQFVSLISRHQSHVIKLQIEALHPGTIKK